MHRVGRVDGVLLDLLMAVMNSLDAWRAAAGDDALGLAWRDAATARMIATGEYRPYEGLVEDAAEEAGLGRGAAGELWRRWALMDPWPDATAIEELRVPFGFLTNCSEALGALAVERSGLDPRLVLSAEACGWYKPDPHAYADACRTLGTAPEHTAFIAGAPYDADGAQRAGLRAFLVRRRPEHRAPHPSIVEAASLGEVVAMVNQSESRTGT